MAFSKEAKQKIQERIADYIQAERPPEHILPQLDIDCRLEGQSVTIYEIRPRFDKPEVKMEIAIAKATYVKTQKSWKIYWMRADLKWHSYKTKPEVPTLQQFFDEVKTDRAGCFYG